MMRRAALLALLLLLADVSRANDRCTVAHDISKAKVAPCSGVLIPEAVARECVSLRISLVPRLKLRVSELEETAKINAAAWDAQRQAYEQEAATLRTTLRTLTVVQRPDPVVVGLLSAAGAALIVGAAWIAVEASR